ncbi:Mn2+/Fe2+ NRAMP family transporter [Tamaricihabitans halophyticus]|uniref:Mn2+/Fe2+ NRAMP family transporter n=1 Tax=Tamaricihabitans halophyticus TaxID=1262583 RepID=A0A4R2QZY0_9PSEU|nr:Nramp family divalent metal transporter [Tamaricihabitans halophyticus]TCP54964.1 Mn2+/Fe2+ NRAMP family transporter [Tamaricihabitans halophyticus]
MSTQDATSPVPAEPAEQDAYRLRAEDVREAPTTFVGRLRYLGPGIVLTAAVVGSGELIVTTSLGAQAGFALLWMVIVGATVKVWVQMELARWAILNGKTALAGYSTVPPRIGRMGWINWLWIGLDFAKTFQRGGVIGGTAAACSILWPIMGDPLSGSSLTMWTVIITVVTVALLRSSKYSVVERITTCSVAIFTLCTITIVVLLPWTPFAYSAGDLGTGLSFMIPAGTVGLAVAMFGSTGVGADDMTNYTYWCLEKGYARWTGPDDGSEARAKRAEGWLKVMRLDVFVSWLICTVSTLAFYLMGASVLHPQNLVPEGNDIITTLSRIYTDILGPWAEYLFLFGAIAVLFSTNVTSCAAVPRLWTNTLGLLGVLDWHDPKARARGIRIFTYCLPVLWAAMFLFVQSPLVMFQIGAIATGIFLLAVLFAVWRLRSTEVEDRFKENPLLTLALVLASIGITVLGIYTILEVFGFSIQG